MRPRGTCYRRCFSVPVCLSTCRPASRSFGAGCGGAQALPARWLQEAYDEWRAGVRDGDRLIDRLNANERERLSPAQREKAEERMVDG
jgi:hypothetical protein